MHQLYNMFDWFAGGGFRCNLALCLLLGRSLMIGWRKKSWNPERVPSVVTLCVCLCVCPSVNGLQVTPFDLGTQFLGWVILRTWVCLFVCLFACLALLRGSPKYLLVYTVKDVLDFLCRWVLESSVFEPCCYSSMTDGRHFWRAGWVPKARHPAIVTY